MTSGSSEQSIAPVKPSRMSYRDSQRQVFLSELAMTSCVSAAAKKAGLAKSTIYLWREKDRTFASAWREALASGYELLESELLERARHGVRIPVFHRGVQVGTIRRHNDHIALRLLSLHRQTAALERAARAHEPDIGTIRARIDAKLDAMRARLANRDTGTEDAPSIEAKSVGHPD